MQQMVGNWKLVVLERYAKFDGRARRAEFWWFVLANFLIHLVLLALVGIGFAIADGLGFVLLLVEVGYWLAVLVPSIAVAVRRLHDTDKSGWLLLLTLLGAIPIVGLAVFVVFIVFYATEGTPGPNRFGAGPEPAVT
jgi:uncharacterized membrane protein YhaH (DUF805 family)